MRRAFQQQVEAGKAGEYMARNWRKVKAKKAAMPPSCNQANGDANIDGLAQTGHYAIHYSAAWTSLPGSVGRMKDFTILLSQSSPSKKGML
jgi:hypothetical protein